MVATKKSRLKVGVGLRSAHYERALEGASAIDFVEVHAENFFAEGGANLNFLDDVAEKYPISLHATALGLGSKVSIPKRQLDKLVSLVERVNPFMLSDHAASAWSNFSGGYHHAGDLLPIAFNAEALDALCKNVDLVQHRLQRQIFVENISAYVELSNSTMDEPAFLIALTKRTGCKLLVDLNNLVVNAINQHKPPLLHVTEWIEHLPHDAVGEIHLAGCRTPTQHELASGELMIDDHSEMVSELVWQCYRHMLRRHGAFPTLIEWDTALPAWEVLVAEAEKVKKIAAEEEYVC